MRMNVVARFGGGTDPDLIVLAEWRARFEVTRALSRGEDPEGVRRLVIGRFRADLVAESFGIFADEVLMATIQRSIEEALMEASSN